MAQTFLTQLPVGAAYAVNAVATFFAVVGAWLWLATRWREQRAPAGMSYTPRYRMATVKLNRFFYQVGAVCLLAALGLSQLSGMLA